MTITAATPKKSTLYMMHRMLRCYLRPYAGNLALALLLMAVAAASTAVLAQLMQPILDDVLSGERLDMVWPVASAVFITFVLRGLTTYAHTIMMSKIGQSVVADIQKDLFSHFLRLDLAFFHAHPSGQLIARVISDVNVMRVAVTDSSAGVGKSFLTLLFLIGVMFYQDWKLSLAAFCIFPFLAIFVVMIGKRLRDISKRTQSELGALTDRLSQIFQGIRQVFAYGMEDYERGRAMGAIDRVKKMNIKIVRTGELSTPVNEVMIGIVIAGIILYGGYQAAEGAITAGQLGAFLAAFTLAYEPMKKLAKLNNTMQVALGAAERVFDMIDRPPLIADKAGAADLVDARAGISFEGVTFRYEGADGDALCGISFMAEPGHITALVGPSGGGKSTIINLIPRFYDVAGGRVCIGAQDTRDLGLASLRRQIALVSQDITIFDDTIAANIAYGKQGATQAEIEDAAKKAAAAEFIEKLPEGYGTRVGEDGVKLSGGQRQRLAIARAILRDAPILLLDEATSALDNESEELVQKALAELERGRTTIAIAHRLSTVKRAHKIIVLDRGRIAEEGTHEGLMARDGLYARMYRAGLKP